MPRRRGALTPAAYADLRMRVIERFGYRCGLCGRRASENNPLQVHHVTKRGVGGADAERNLIPLCAWECHPKMDRNGWKTYRPLLEARIATVLERLA